MAWTFKRIGSGDDDMPEIEAHDGKRVRAIIRHRKAHALPWQVCRVTVTSRGDDVRGGDCFRTLAVAKEFCQGNPSVWGVTDAECDAYVARLAAADIAAGIE